jgi:predicted outer membrane lipoprotein
MTPEIITTEAQLKEIERRALSASSGSGHFSKTNRSSNPVINIMLPCVQDSPNLVASLRAAWAQRDEALRICQKHAFDCGWAQSRLNNEVAANERLCAEIEKLRKSDGVVSRNMIIAALACAFVIMTAFALALRSQGIRDAAESEQRVKEFRTDAEAEIVRQRQRGDEWKSDFGVCLKKAWNDEVELDRLRRNRAILEPFIREGRLVIVQEREP